LLTQCRKPATPWSSARNSRNARNGSPTPGHTGSRPSSRFAATTARELLANALRSLAEVERKLRDADGARRHYEESVAILRNCHDRLRLAHTVRHLGDVHHDAGRADLAAPCYDEALALYSAHPDPAPLDLANAIHSMAVLEQEVGDREKTIALWGQARELYASLQVDAGVAECTARLAKLGV